MNFLQGIVHGPIKVAVGVLLVALFGFISLFRMPMQLTPEVETPTLTIRTNWTGASPEEIEREIVLEQEEQLKSVEGVTKMTSESVHGRGEIVLEFAVGTNMNETLLTVNSRLAQVPEYPETADQPVITTRNVSDRPIARFMLDLHYPGDEKIRAAQKKHPQLAEELEAVLRAHSHALALYRLEKLAAKHPELRDLPPRDIDITKLLRFVEDKIEPRYERVRGVSAADVGGGLEQELRVEIDPVKLAARKLTFYDVRDVLRGESVDTSGGELWEGKRRYIIRTLGQFESPEEVENVLLAVREGSPVYVRDVGRVVLGFKKPASLVRRFGRVGISVSVSRETGANVLEVMEGLRQVTRDLNENLLAERGLALVQTYDATDYIYAALDLVKDNIIVGGLLTVAVLLLFLRSGGSTLVISLAIPTSIIGTFLILHLLGRSLNVISLAGLAFAIGMLVDNAIVVLENIYTHHQRGEPPLTAAIRGAQEVWGAIAASTMTTLAVFLPVLFVQQEAGQLFRDIALAISAAVGLSMVVSILVIPACTPRLLKAPADKPPSRAALARLFAPLDVGGALFVTAVVRINVWLQRGVARQLIFVVAMVAASLGLTYLLVPDVEYLPTGNRNTVYGSLVPPPGYNIDQLLAMGAQVERKLIPYWDVDPGSPQALDPDQPPIVSYFFFVARGRRVFMGISALDPARAKELVPLVRKVTADLPGTVGVAKQSSLFERGLSGGRTVEIAITGPDLTRLVEIGRRVMQMAHEVVPGGQYLPIPSLDISSPQIHLEPRRRRSEDLKMNAAEIGYTVDALVDGAYATDYYLKGDKIDLTIAGQQRFAERTQDLENLPIATPAGKLVPLSSLARVDQFSWGPQQILRRERQRAITIEVTPPPSMPIETAQHLIEANIVGVLRDEGVIGDDYHIRLGGTTDKLRQTWRALRFNLLLALLITYLLMAALFESWLYPFVIILTVPLGAVGGVAALWLVNFFVAQPLDVLTMLGFIMLIGTVVNNPILIVHQSLNHMREDGMTPRAAILESVRGRIRPIFMTTTTTILGLLPLVIFPGAGSELYRGLGAVMLGGLLVSTIFTLVFVPTLFDLTLRARAALWKRFFASALLPLRAAPEGSLVREGELEIAD